MSERLNSVDIEDVLSSIRRLVSDDARPAARTAAQPVAQPTPHVAPHAAPPAEPLQADKLILTPALRIAPEPEPASQPQADLAAQPDPAEEDNAASDPVMSFYSVRPERGAARLDAVMGQVAQGLDAGPGDWEAAAEPPLRFESDWAAAEEELAAEMAGPDDDGGVSGADRAPTYTTVDAQTASPDPLDLRDPMDAAPVWSVAAADAPFVTLDTGFDVAAAAHAGRELVGEVALSADVLSADVLSGDVLSGDGGDDVILGGSLDAGPVDDAANDDVRDVTSDRISDDLGDDWPAQDWAAPGEPDLAAVSAEDAGWSGSVPMDMDRQPVALAEEPAMTDKDDPADLPDWARMEAEPVDTAPPNPPAAQQLHRASDDLSADDQWADAAEAEIRRELEDAVQPQAFAHFADDDLDDRAFDEDMLRDLVRDIIREELQGALGERITRNVRKLVRAEIARALAVRDFE